MIFTLLSLLSFEAFFQITEEGYIFGTDNWADPITLFGPHDWLASDDAPEYCSWDGPGEEPTCSAHHYEEGLIHLAHQAGAEGMTTYIHVGFRCRHKILLQDIIDGSRLFLHSNFNSISFDWRLESQ